MYQQDVFQHTPEALELAFSSGEAAAKATLYYCDYQDNASLFSKFCDGFVAKGAGQENLPANTPAYLVGRVAYLKGLTPSEQSRSNTPQFSGQWLSGWLAQQVKQRLAG